MQKKTAMVALPGIPMPDDVLRQGIKIHRDAVHIGCFVKGRGLLILKWQEGRSGYWFSSSENIVWRKIKRC